MSGSAWKTLMSVPSDGRILKTCLTQRGRSLLNEGHERVQAIERRMSPTCQSPSGLRLLRMLRICADALQPYPRATKPMATQG